MIDDDDDPSRVKYRDLPGSIREGLVFGAILFAIVMGAWFITGHRPMSEHRSVHTERTNNNGTTR